MIPLHVSPGRLPIYLDHNATTPVDERVLAAMAPYFRDSFGNAASLEHGFGLSAHAGVSKARDTVAACLNAHPDEIVFTSGATESNNLALKGVADQVAAGHFVTAASEHKAVLEPCRQLARRGHRVTYLGVDATGAVDPAEL
ncbi:MAG TPA: aminotransferase class V-fold PLP-dependent enzyme, partial [Vicinamibacteria bacterium]|nr:aminotransferase class V-fold PLP-dependent enzyme [Vicinamibacteria bacterium]